MVALGLSSVAIAQQPAAQPQILDCTEFSKKTDEAALVKRFGRENVVNAKLDGAEGEATPGTVVYPKDPSRRLEVTWWDTSRRRGLSGITVRGKSEWMVRTPGRARDTVGLRISLAELEEANEKPFQISGFGWDYGGYATDWKGGKLDHMAPASLASFLRKAAVSSRSVTATEAGCSFGTRTSKAGCRAASFIQKLRRLGAGVG
ncbi:hypothetical protein [Methylobacterium sp. Leaf456]|uniref:hypothetical protein n=1 Tax=Methylobacterium sp. Leaf456 TaxID=1736382 RepID=UPI0007005790|nr:hypothetical protein [Methylobacterium sp. Leaf456]